MCVCFSFLTLWEGRNASIQIVVSDLIHIFTVSFGLFFVVGNSNNYDAPRRNKSSHNPPPTGIQYVPSSSIAALLFECCLLILLFCVDDFNIIIFPTPSFTFNSHFYSALCSRHRVTADMPPLLH